MASREGSVTPNSMMILERGAGGSETVVGPGSRPPSGRRSRNKTPIQRSGSQLEILPPDDGKEKHHHGSRPSSRSNSRSGVDSPRQSQSAGSSGRASSLSQESEGLTRSSSVDVVSAGEKSSKSVGAHKNVSLTTVKRNFETHGLPKNDTWNFVPKDAISSSPPLTNGTVHSTEIGGKSVGAYGGLHVEGKGAQCIVNGGTGDGHRKPEEEMTEQRLKHLMQQLSMKNDEIKQNEERMSAKQSRRKDETLLVKAPDSTRQTHIEGASGGQPSNDKLQGERMEAAENTGEEENDEDDEEEEDDDEEDDGPKAPIELMGEFLDAVMEEEYETADKLCKMILLYEPENAECMQFKPLIEEMLRREHHYQLWGTDSEDESGDEDEDDDDDEDEEEDSGDEDDSDEDESDSDSSEESEEEENVGDENPTGKQEQGS